MIIKRIVAWQIWVALKNSSWYWISPNGMRSKGRMGVIPSSLFSAMILHRKYTTFGFFWASSSHIALQAVSTKPLMVPEIPALEAKLQNTLSATLSRAWREAIRHNDESNSRILVWLRRVNTFGSTFFNVDSRCKQLSFSRMRVASIACWTPVNISMISTIFSGSNSWRGPCSGFDGELSVAGELAR